MTTADLQLTRLVPSPVHLRRGKDKIRDTELLESVKRHGVLQPVLVRPLTDGEESIEVRAYELVAGHRRYEAAKGAKLETIPALVRTLTDAEALELQVVENQQRSDVHPLEEAEGYRLLTEKHGYTVEQIAAKVGKSRGYVYARMKLGALGRAGRTAFLDGKLDAATALLVARIPEALQDKALKEIQSGVVWDDGRRTSMPYRQAAAHVQQHYMLRLADAPFDTGDAALGKGGACGPCPKRTGNQAELFGDVKGADICTDPLCWRVKVAAAVEAQRARLKAEGKTILSAAEAKKVFPPSQSGLAWNAGYQALDHMVWVGNRQVGLEALIRKHDPKTPTVFCPRQDGVLVELVGERDAKRLTALASRKPKGKGKAAAAADPDPKEARREAELMRRAERADLVRAATLALVVEKLPKAKDDALWLALAPLMDGPLDELGDDEALDRLLARYGAEPPKDFSRLRVLLRETVGSLVGRARGIVVETILMGYGAEQRDLALRDLVKLLRITPEQVKRRANAEQAASAERQKQAATKDKAANDEDEAGMQDDTEGEDE